MRTEVTDSIAAFEEKEWNALTGGRITFLRHEFLLAAERSGSATAESGWAPRHIGLFDDTGGLRAAMPLYEKSDSWGEFVFDWSWAQAYGRAGLDYYPKLVSAIPFTPATGPRLLCNDPDEAARLLEAALELAKDVGTSSLHVLFPEESELPYFRQAGMKLRKDCQFHWHNPGYANFADFLATFSSAKRKKVRRERRAVEEQGIQFRRYSGAELDVSIWKDIYELISLTFIRRGSLPYFNLDFFLELTARLPEHVLAIVAEKSNTPVAAAVFFDTEDVLYGRYWGADSHYNALHFETCYYQGIDYCIEQKRKLFEPGTQGEHKISRGFIPATTWSAHWLARPEFFAAVGEFLKAERNHVDEYMHVVNTHSPYKNGTSS